MTLAEHCRWCISNIPITPAERTIFWFLYGFDSSDEIKFERYLERKYNVDSKRVSD